MCDTVFHSRIHLLTHLADKRVRSKHRLTSCGVDFLLTDPAEIDPIVLESLNSTDREAKKAALARGHTHVIASTLARKVRPRKTLKSTVLSPVCVAN